MRSSAAAYCPYHEHRLPGTRSFRRGPGNRMPEKRRLATLIGAEAPVDDAVRQLARMLAAFHAGARRGPVITAEGGRDALRGRWVDHFTDLPRSLTASPRIRLLASVLFLGRQCTLFPHLCPEYRDLSTPLHL
jgi:hypothetical protein